MARVSSKTKEELQQERHMRVKRIAEREEFKKQVFDKRRYRLFTTDELLSLRSVIDDRIEAKKAGAIKELEKQKAEIDKKIGELSA